LARFFRAGVQLGLDKGKVGEFLGEKDEFCLAVLQEYAKSFAFENVPLVAALRAFLQEFQLPGESQKID
jgi:brefeldin A-resistance guanine nucleotide exchange factor 1